MNGEVGSSALTHIMSLEEVAWGSLLIGLTMVVHAIAMAGTLAVCEKVRLRHADSASFLAGVRVLLLASVMIVIAHLGEVAVWAAFFLVRGAFPTTSSAYYFALLQYTTVGSELSLPDRWRLLGGMIAMAGTLSFAWSTAVLLTLAQHFRGNKLRQKSLDQPRDT